MSASTPGKTKLGENCRGFNESGGSSKDVNNGNKNDDDCNNISDIEDEDYENSEKNSLDLRVHFF